MNDFESLQTRAEFFAESTLPSSVVDGIIATVFTREQLSGRGSSSSSSSSSDVFSAVAAAASISSAVSAAIGPHVSAREVVNNANFEEILKSQSSFRIFQALGF